MKREQEKAFLGRFAQSAVSGELVSVADVQHAYEKQIGRSTPARSMDCCVDMDGARLHPDPRIAVKMSMCLKTSL